MRKALLTVAALGILLLTAPQVNAIQYTYTNIDVPGYLMTVPMSLNNTGQVVGYVWPTATSPGALPFSYQSGSNSVYSAPYSFKGQFTRINNSGQVVGVDGYPSWGGPTPTGFLNTFNNLNTSGTYSGISVYVLGMDPNTGQPVSYPSETYVTGINDSGTMVGYYYSYSVGGHTSFLTNSTGMPLQTLSPITVPGYGQNWAYDINNDGQIVGFVQNPNVGFIKTGDNYEFVDVAGLFNAYSDSRLVAINNSGQAIAQVGVYSSLSYNIQSKTFSPIELINLPSEYFGLQVWDINDQGQIVGYYFDRTWNGHGFIATPLASSVPLPGSLLLLSTGLIRLGAVGLRRRCS